MSNPSITNVINVISDLVDYYQRELRKKGVSESVIQEVFGNSIKSNQPKTFVSVLDEPPIKPKVSVLDDDEPSTESKKFVSVLDDDFLDEPSNESNTFVSVSDNTSTFLDECGYYDGAVMRCERVNDTLFVSFKDKNIFSKIKVSLFGSVDIENVGFGKWSITGSNIAKFIDFVSKHKEMVTDLPSSNSSLRSFLKVSLFEEERRLYTNDSGYVIHKSTICEGVWVVIGRLCGKIIIRLSVRDEKILSAFNVRLITKKEGFSVVNKELFIELM